MAILLWRRHWHLTTYLHCAHHTLLLHVRRLNSIVLFMSNTDVYSLHVFPLRRVLRSVLSRFLRVFPSVFLRISPYLRGYVKTMGKLTQRTPWDIVCFAVVTLYYVEGAFWRLHWRSSHVYWVHTSFHISTFMCSHLCCLFCRTHIFVNVSL